VPVTPAERLQAEADLALWRAEQPLPYGEPVPVAVVEEVEAEPEKSDPVTWIDRWRWRIAADDRRKQWHLMRQRELEEERQRIRDIVEKGARQKRDEVFCETRKELIELYSTLKGE
jgi:Spy/CpxP family protein refolding chaperone